VPETEMQPAKIEMAHWLRYRVRCKFSII